MTKGKAAGPDRAYQVFVRDVILQLRERERLVPYSGDGIDVAVAVGGGVEITFDVALRDDAGRIVVVEGRRWREASPIKQEAIFAFAGKAERLRRAHGTEVAAMFVTSAPYQSGAVKTGALEGVDIIRCAQGQLLPDFVVVYRQYDPAREAVLQRGEAHLHVPTRVGLTLELVVNRADPDRQGGE